MQYLNSVEFYWLFANIAIIALLLQYRYRFVPALRIEEFQDKLRECTIFGSIDIKETYHQIAIDVKIANLWVIRTTHQWGR